MTELFNRDLTLNVGGAVINMHDVDPITRRIRPMLRVRFVVEKSGNRDPNRAEVIVYNLNRANRKVLEEGSNLLEKTEGAFEWPLVIEAGYVGSKSQIFSGDITYANSVRSGVDWVTTIEAEDGGKKYASKRINKSYGPGTTLQILLTDLAKALGVGLGNSAAKFAAAATDVNSRVFKRNFKRFQKGVVVRGRVSRNLDRYITSAGFLWSIQDGQLQVLGPDEVVVGTAVVLNKSTGLIGAPEKGEKGIVTARSLMQGLIIPGRRVILESESVTGQFKARDLKHFGDSHGNDWYTDFEGKPVDVAA
jgi:hypothetical protein